MRLSALNAIACMCQAICYVTSSNTLGKLVLCEKKRWDRGRWDSTPDGCTEHGCVSGLGCKNPSVGPYSLILSANRIVILPHRASMQYSRLVY